MNFSMRYRGNNPITSSEDTVSKWSELGPGFWYISNTNTVKNQPFQWGYIINFTHFATEVHQIWLTQSHGNCYHRGGNGSGWGGSWTPFSPGTANCAQVLKGYTFSSANGVNLTGTYDPGNDYNNGYNSGYNAALTMKTLTGTTGTSPGTATYTDETGKTKKVQYRTASYNISGTIHAIYMHVSNSVDYPSLYTRASGTIFTAQRATGYCIFKAQSPAYINNRGFNLPIYAASGPGSKTFSYTIWYS